LISRGANGSIQFEMARPDHTDLDFALGQIMRIKEHGNEVTAKLSIADLIQLGGIAAVEFCGGPKIPFKVGRVDVTTEGPQGMLPNPADPATMSTVFKRYGFTDRNIVAMMGVHTLGKCKPDVSGWDGTWTANPFEFDNSYYKELLLREEGKYLQTPSDKELVSNPAFLPHVEEFAGNQEVFFEEFSKVLFLLGSLGQTQNLRDEL